MHRTAIPLAILFATNTAFAAEIREFDIKTTERLGNELVRLSERPDRGVNTSVKKRAKDTAVAALRGKLYDGVHYDYMVLDDPVGKGFLVYALAAAKTKGDVITGGHYRVTISPDRTSAKRVDLLSQLIHQPKPDAGTQLAGIAASQIAGKLPVETWIYSSYIYHLPMFVAVVSDGSIWGVANGRIVRADENGPKNHLDISTAKPRKFRSKNNTVTRTSMNTALSGSCWVDDIKSPPQGEIREFDLKKQIPAFNFFLGTHATGSLSFGSP